jgi:serine/threonine protein kinase
MATQQDNWEAVKALFEAALEVDVANRSSFLKERCLDANLRAEVERLLTEHDEAASFLSTPALGNVPREAEIRGARLSEGELLAGRFRIIRFIASGGVGEVYEAEDQELREHVALKTIRPEILVQPNAMARFKREVHLARQVTHPNVCRIFDLFRHRAGDLAHGETVFISMELLHGKTLGERLKEGGRMSTEEAEPLVRQMASALASAHKAGIIHRDFKPGNVVLVGTPGGWRAVVTDFGLALRSVTCDDTASLPTGQALLGTPAYMSPEQIEGRQATTASDIYALGLVIYEMVSGRRPFQGDTPMSAAMKRLSVPPTPPRNVVPELSPVWEAVILRCLEREPAKRFAGAQDVVAALSRGGVFQNDARGIEQQTRVLEAAAPQESAVGRSTEVVAMVRRTDSGGLRRYLDQEAVSAFTSKDVRERAFELEFTQDALGKLQPAEICLRLESPDFHPPSQTKKLRVPPQGDSPLCTFLIRPTVAGNLIANLELLKGEEIVVSRRIETRALIEGSPIVPGINIVSIPLTILVQSSTGEFKQLFGVGQPREPAGGDFTAMFEAVKPQTEDSSQPSGLEGNETASTGFTGFFTPDINSRAPATSAPLPPAASPPPIPSGPSSHTQIISLKTAHSPGDRADAGRIAPARSPELPASPAPSIPSLRKAPRMPSTPKAPAPKMPKIAIPSSAPKPPKEGAVPPPPVPYWPLILTLTVLFFIAVLLVLYFALKH